MINFCGTLFTDYVKHRSNRHAWNYRAPSYAWLLEMVNSILRTYDFENSQRYEED